MNAVKHQPATPLPWRASADGIVGQRSLLTVATGVKFLDDRDYASHAGNAYPELIVELLKERNDRAASVKTDPRNAVHHQDRANAIDALLTKFGEGS